MSNNKTDKDKGALSALLLTVFINMLGVGIVIPLLGILFYSPEGPFYNQYSDVAKGILYGIIIAAYPFAQFLGAPILGDLSDKYGRKKLLIVSSIGTLVSYLVVAFGITQASIALLLIGRLADGFTGGNISIAQSAISDISTPETKTKNFGLIGMIFGIGFIIGPVLGGVLSDSSVVSWFTYSTPFIFGAILTFINIVLIIFLLPETLKVRGEAKFKLTAGFSNLAKAFKLKQLRYILMVSFLLILGFNFFTQFFNVYLITEFNFDQLDIGYLFGYTGIWIALTQGGLIRPLAKRYKPENILIYSILAMAIAMPLLLVPNEAKYLYLVIPLIAISNGISSPNLLTVVSNHAGAETQGEILGVNQAIQSLALMIPPLVSGLVVSFHVSIPTILSTVSIFLAWILFVRFYKSKGKEQILHD